MEGDGRCEGASRLHCPETISKAFLPAYINSLSLSSTTASVNQQLIIPSPAGKRSSSFQTLQPRVSPSA